METVSQGTSIVIGEADFDLAYYANNAEVLKDKLPLKNCTMDPNAFIEIFIKTNGQEVIANNTRKPGVAANEAGGLQP